MTGKKSKTKNKNSARSIIHIKIFTVVIVSALAIVGTGLAVGAVFLTRSVRSAIESNMLAAADIANEYVSKQMLMLKIEAAETASEIRRLNEAGHGESALESVLRDYRRNLVLIENSQNEYFPNEDSQQYIGLALFDENGPRGYAGVPPPRELYREKFMRIAFAGGQSISTTMYVPDSDNEVFVMYISAPVGDGLALAAALPGLFFSELISQFKFWDTGHLFIDDEGGNIIVNNRPQWVMTRRNFIELDKIEGGHEGVSGMVKRGMTGERGTDQFSISDIQRICAFRPISMSNENWFLGIIAPLNESSIKDIPKGIALIASIMFALSVIAAALAARYLKRPYADVDRLRIEAEIASISKSTFLANMSHEIRTPMNSVIGFTELALDNELPPKIRDYLVKIKINTEWLLQIINDILDISKIESGKMELENIPFDLSEIFNSCRVLILPKVQEKGIAMHFYSEPSIGKKPLGDPVRLRQVFTNLLSNSVKFTNTGMVKLYSSLKKLENNTVTLYFEVKDSGIGMTPEQIKMIFDPFVQAESSTMRKYGGTGLGLTITRDIIELMGGKLSVESAPGLGSKFSFELTFNTIDVAEERAADKVTFNNSEKPLFEGEILLCEDNVMNQQVISEHLERIGFKTIIAENGKVGVDMVLSRREKGQKQFDLIFMDMHMPVMDGLEAAAKIFDLDTGVPIVAMTANIMVNDMDLYKKSGMSDCVGKPFTSQELWKCLLKYLKPVNWQKEDSILPEIDDSNLQQKIINIFVSGNMDFLDRFKTALNMGDVKLAHRMAHTMKSNAGQLKKTNLLLASEEIENSLKNGKNLITHSQMETFITELDSVLLELTPLVYYPSRSTPVSALDDKQTLEIFDKLSVMLEEGDSECFKLTDTLMMIPGSAELIQRIEEYNFESALEALNILKNEMLR